MGNRRRMTSKRDQERQRQEEREERLREARMRGRLFVYRLVMAIAEARRG